MLIIPNMAYIGLCFKAFWGHRQKASHLVGEGNLPLPEHGIRILVWKEACTYVCAFIL